MSNLALCWASDQKTGSPQSKLILLMLSDRAGMDQMCRVPLPEIAEYCEMDISITESHLRHLNNNGFIAILVSSGSDNRYLLNMEARGDK